MPKVVLITGCSSGIGRDAVVRLTEAGHRVAATARKVETLADLPAALKLSLDVTRPESVRQAVESVVQQFGRIDVLVNNAGYALRAAVEEVPVTEAQQMFDVNLFGVMRMVQAVTPHMRSRSSGCIINISSIAGIYSTPANGAYSASKFALEALSDSLRWELAPFGIAVVLVEPGSIRTQFEKTVHSNSGTALANPASPYRILYRVADEVASGMRKGEPGPEAVSAVIQQIVESPHPPARCLAGVPLSSRLVFGLGRPFWDAIVHRMWKIALPAKELGG